MKDAKLRGASRAAKNIVDVHGAPQDLGQPYTYDQIFSTSNSLMPASIQREGTPNRTDILAAQHANFDRPFVGTLDQIDRGADYPDAPVLESQFMGQGREFTPPSASNTSTMLGRKARKSGGTKGGDFSSAHNRHPL